MKTGDNGLNIVVAVLMVVISVTLIVVCIKKRKSKQLLSIVLCISIAGTMAIYGGYIQPNAAESVDDYSVDLEEIVKVDGNNVSISSNVKYDRIATVFPTQYDEMGNIDSRDPDIEIYDFKADTYDIPVGEEKEVTFTAEVFSDVVLGDNDVSVVNKYGELIGHMNDKGVDGDAVAGDGVYSLKTTMCSENPIFVSYYCNVNDVVSTSFYISYNQQFDNADYELAYYISETIGKQSISYLDEYGDVKEEDLNSTMNVIRKVVDNLQTQGTVSQYYMNDSSVIITTNNGYSFEYGVHVSGTSNNATNVNIATFQPFKNTYGIGDPNQGSTQYIKKLNEESDKATDDMANLMTRTFGFNFSGNFDSESVTLNLLENIGNYQIIIWDGHGGYNDIVGAKIATGEIVEKGEYGETIDSVTQQRYSDDIGQQNQRVMECYCYVYSPDNSCTLSCTYAVSGGFFDKYLAIHNADMKNAFIYLGTCHSGEDMIAGHNINTHGYHLVQSFIDHGASVVIANSGTVNTNYNHKMMRETIFRMNQGSEDWSKYDTVRQALDYALNKHGQNDNNGTHPFIIGDQDYSFEILKNASNNISENYGTISGKIIDSESGYGIQGALVRIYKDDRLVSKVRTDSHGNYSDDMLRPGNYVLKISDSYYHSMKIAVTVNANETTYNETALMFKVINNPVKKAYGIINNAVNGMAISGATIKVRQNWNNKNGEIITEVATNESGKYEIELSEGFFTLEVIKDGYITSYGNIVIGSLGVSSQDISLSPVINDSTYRVVLTWNDNPSDLDSHLFGKVNDIYDYHIYYQNKSKSYGGETIANLDRDDTDGNGPETTVFDTLPDGEYDYYVDWYKGTGTWASSGGKIDIYNGNTLIKTVNVPNIDHNNGSWKVFSVKNGVFTLYNTIQDEDIYRG